MRTICRPNRGWLVALLLSAAPVIGPSRTRESRSNRRRCRLPCYRALDLVGITYADPGHAITAAKAMCRPCANGVTRLYSWSRDLRDYNPGADHGQRGRIRCHRIRRACPEHLEHHEVSGGAFS
ncbi:DUF732 domain-containing protein [Mycobacterium tuberculosis]|uniref:DUF732 domain-containing protein n=1 Tax=Mycobacterium tuberculosis TaxID=1773 RepID=UPI0032B4D0AA